MNVQSLIHRVLKSGMPDSEKVEWIADLSGVELTSSVTEEKEEVKQKPNGKTPQAEPKTTWISTGEAASLVGFTPPSILNWIHAGEIKYKTTGSGATLRYHIDRDNLLQYIEEKNKRPRPGSEPGGRRSYSGGPSKYTSIEDIQEWDSMEGAARRLAVQRYQIDSLIEAGKVKVIDEWGVAGVNVRQVKAALEGKTYTPNMRWFYNIEFAPIRVVAEMLGLDATQERSLSDGAKKGAIANHRIGSRRLISVSDAKRYLKTLDT